MARLRSSLTRPGGGTAAIAGSALHGLGGVGKTRTAVEYAWAHAGDYTALLLLDAETPEKLDAGLAALTGPLRLAEHAAAEQAARVEAALAWLNANPGWFLILDNIDSAAALDAAHRLLGRLKGGQVVLTSRLDRFPREVDRLDLDVLALDAAAAFLLVATAAGRRQAADDAAQAHALAGELGQLALALEMAAATIEARRMSFAQYREVWRGNRARVVGWAAQAITGYHHAVAETWQTSVDQLGAPGRLLLERLAFLAPDPVPVFLLDVPVPGVAAEDAVAALDDLATYSLATRDAEGEAFLVHRLVQDVTRRGLEQAGTARARLTEALSWVDGAFKCDPLDVDTWVQLDPLVPHADVVIGYADQAQVEAPTDHLRGELFDHLRRRAIGRLKARMLAERQRPESKRRKWTVESVCKWIELVNALFEGGLLTREEYLFYSVFSVERIHDDRITDGSYKEDLESITDRMDKIKKDNGLSEGQYWPSGSGPEEYESLSREWDAVIDAKFEEVLREFGLHAQANLWQNDRLEYDRRREAGRQCVFGPLPSQRDLHINTSPRQKPPTGSAKQNR